MAENKVIFGLKNVHYAVITEETDDLLTYAEPVRIRGAVSMTMTPQGEQTEFYADDILFYGETSNTGYEVGLEIARMPEQFRIDALGEIVDANGVLLEDANAKSKRIAIMFEFATKTPRAIACLIVRLRVRRNRVRRKRQRRSRQRKS